jgi:hypothetical protein
MSKTLAVGTQVAIAKTYVAAQTFSSITNAAEAVASFASNPSYAVGDILEITSGWGRLNNRVVRVKAISGAGPYLVTLESIDTTSTARFPAGNGAGTARKISAWDVFTQVANIEIGDPTINYADGSDYDNPVDIRIPASIQPPDGTITFHADGTLAWLPTVRSASESNAQTAIRLITPAGAPTYGNAFWLLSEFPQLAGRTETVKQKVTFGFSALPIGYAS